LTRIPTSQAGSTPPPAPIARRPRSLTRFLRLEALQALQDRFSRLGQFSICICGTDGEPITRPMWGSRYSQLIGTSSTGKVEWSAGLKAACAAPRANPGPTCHEGMSLYAAPMLYRRERLGAIVVGTRDVASPSDYDIEAVAAKYGVNTAELVEAGRPEFAWTGGTPEAIHQFADLLADTIATLYGQADRIGEQLSDLRIVHGLSDLLAGTHSPQQILDITVRQVVEVMGVKACVIRLLNEESGELVIKAVHNLSSEYLKKGPVRLDQSVIDTTAFAGHTVYIEDAPTDPRTRYPDQARREGLVSGLCVPMTFRGRTVGVLRAYTGRKYRFTEMERQLLRSIASQAAAAVITTQLYEGRAAAEHVRRQVEAAAEIQRRMLPARPPSRPGLDIGAVYDPSLQVGGDFYDFIEWPGGGVGICVADVVGKGLPAALMMASTRSSLRAHAGHSQDMAEVVGKVNRDLCRDLRVSEFVTLVFGVFSPDGRSFTSCNAGHLPIVWLRDGQVRYLNAGGLVIGVDSGEVFEEETVPLQPDDLLVVVTDGVTEAFDFDDTAYGWDRFITSVRRHESLDAQRLAQQLHWDVRRFVGLAEQSDDITIVVVKVRG